MVSTLPVIIASIVAPRRSGRANGLRLSRGRWGGALRQQGSQVNARWLVSVNSSRPGNPVPDTGGGSRLEARVRPSVLTRSESMPDTAFLARPSDHAVLATTRPPSDAAKQTPPQLLLLRRPRTHARGGPLPPPEASAHAIHLRRRHRLNRGTPSLRPGQRLAHERPAQWRPRVAMKIKPGRSMRLLARSALAA